MSKIFHPALLLGGLAVVVWVGAGYVGSNPLALTVTTLIAACYLLGAVELHRFAQGTRTLLGSLSSLERAPADLEPWLAELPPSMRTAVRQRVQGERMALPGPALAPYLAGLLVLLGMLGTFFGMVVTLNGTGLLLESAADAHAMRAALSAPVKGLGLAFGTSIAGVAASAMLGLVSALCRRERLLAAQVLDSKTTTTLRAFSLSHHREASLKSLQAQAALMPVLVERLQAMMDTMERQSQALHDRLLAGQDRFHGTAETAFTRLAASVDQSLQSSLRESAQLAAAAIHPIVQASMAGIAREAAALHEAVGRSVERQLDGVAGRFEASSSTVTQAWEAALLRQQATNETLSRDLGGTLGRFAETFEQRAVSMVDDVSAHLARSADHASAQWLAVLEAHERTTRALSADTHQSLLSAAAGFEQQAASLVQALERAHTAQQDAMSLQEERRSVAWSASLESMAASLLREWQQASARQAGEQQQILDSLARTAHDISAQSGAQARSTVAEIRHLVQAAAEAPRAAAEVMASLRRQLSDGMARDNTLLDERNRMLETLGTLLEGVNHASAAQRAAIDGMVAASREMLDRVSSRFKETVEVEAGRMAAAAAQVTGSAVEVASLGESFGFGVTLFSQSSDRLVAQMQGIETALGKSVARSDEQLAYYVAQAREVIDLSIMSQKQIIEELQQLARRRAPVDSEA